MKKNRKILIFVVIIICVIILAILYPYFKKFFIKRSDESEDYTIDLNEKFAENEIVKISIENAYYVDNYLILKYDVKAKDETNEFFDDSMIIDGQFDFHLPRRILINNKTIKTSEQYYDQISHKISDNEAAIYDIIDIGGENIPEKFEIEVRFFENDYTVYEEFDESEIEDDDTDFEAEEEESGIDLSEQADDSEENEQDDEEEDIDSSEYADHWELEESAADDEVFLEENATEEDYEEVVGTYIFRNEYDEEQEKEIDEEETTIIGTIIFKATKNEMKNKCEKDFIDGEYEIDNVKVNNVIKIKTPSDKFLLMDTELRHVDDEKIYKRINGDPYAYSIGVQNEGEKTIVADRAQSVQISTDARDKETTAYIKTFILLDKNVDTCVIQPYYKCEGGTTIGEGFLVD